MQPPAPTSRTYRYPRRSLWSWLAAALLGTAGCGAAIAFQFDARTDLLARGQLLIFTAVFAFLAVHAFTVLHALTRPVRLHREGVQAGSELVPWFEVREVNTQPLLRRFDVLDGRGRRILSLRPELESFGAVRDYIIEHMNPRVEAPPASVPLLTPFRGAVPALALGLLAVWFGPRQSGAPALLLAVLAGALLLRHLLQRRTLLLAPDRLVLREGLAQVVVPYRDISAVRVAREPLGRGGFVHAVVVERRGDEPIGVSGFRGGYRAAAAQIQHAWRGSVA